jgi:hypothetical protein
VFDPIEKETVVSTPHSPVPPLEVRERAACMCRIGGSCTSFEPGHAVHLIQARLASATPSEWVDALVDAVDPVAGTLVVRTILDAAPVLLGNAAAARALSTGAPVALHDRYHVLADGGRWFNVLRDA